MIKKIARPLLVLALTLCIILTQVGFIKAQGITPTPTVTSQIVATQAPNTTVTDPNIVTFEMLQQNDIELIGPYDSRSVIFSLPADWKLSTGNLIELSFSVAFNSIVQDQVRVDDSTLTVYLQNTLLGVIPLNQLGEKSISFPIPLELLESQGNDQNPYLYFVLESGFLCNLDQHTTVFIHPNSRLIIPHELVKPDTNLQKFPSPIIQNSFVPDSAILVVPDKPTAVEMEAALIISAGLNNLSSNTLTLDLTKESMLTEEQRNTNSIIFIGNVASLSTLEKLKLPMPVINSQFENTGGNKDDGVIQMINSPWNNSRAILIVSGNSEVGTKKAAQAISTGIIQSNKTANLAVIDKVQLNENLAPQGVDRTLTEMGYDATLFQNRGVGSTQYTFNIPTGYTVTSDAYFDLIYGNSALLDFKRSGIIVRLNNRPIGSVLMSADTARLATNTSRITIPAAAITTGRNVLDITSNLFPIDDCTPPGVNQGIWANIWPESFLHLPLTTVSVTPTSTQKNLGSYLKDFIYNPILNDTAFVLPTNNLDAWRVAVQLAGNLGNEANGTAVDLTVFYGDAIPVTVRQNYNFIVIGQPSEIPILQDMNSNLPVPFIANSDVPYSTNPQVTYRIPRETPLGFLEILPSQWNPQKVVLAVLGNSKQGVNWAITALIDPTLTTILSGNFAVVNDRQILNTDTNLITIDSGTVPEQNPVETSMPVPETPAQVQTSATNLGWVLPALEISVVLIILIIATVVLGSWSRKRTRGKHE